MLQAAWGGAEGGAGPTRAGVGQGSRTPAARHGCRASLRTLPLTAVLSAYPRVLACPRREPEPLAEVAAGSGALNKNTVGGGLRGATRHGRGGVSTAWGRSRGLGLLRRKPGAEAVSSWGRCLSVAVAARTSPPSMARPRRRRRC